MGTEASVTGKDLAATTLAYLASDQDALALFLDTTGLLPADLRQRVADGTLERALLHHLMSDDRVLVAVAAALDRRPETVARSAASADPSAWVR